MKTVYAFILLAFLLSISSGVHESGARVAKVETRQQQKDGIVTGIYEGYENQIVNILLNNGTRRAYSFSSDKSLLRRISSTTLSTKVVLTVEKGVVVRFEEASK